MSQSMPRQVGKYEIIKKLGHGGFGDVYLAKDTMLGSNVAVKILAPIYMRDPTVVKRFQQEARAAAGLRHPNIVRIYDLGQDQGLLYLAMDYLPGRTLAQVIHDDGPLPLDQVSNTLSQIASALDYAHAKGLIHRDVKPGNVVVDESAHATLTDFGLVKAVDHTQFTILSHTTGGEQFTTGGSAIGTPEYMAPEQADPALGDVGPHTDLYALGVMTYQMIAGRVPFQASTPVATLRAHADLEPPPLAEWSEVPEGVAGVVAKALAKLSGDRWSSASEFASAFAGALEHSQQAETQQARLASLYARAEGALAGREWTRALVLAGQIMDQASTYPGVKDLFQQANAGLVRQQDWENQQAELGVLYDEALEHLSVKDWDQAIPLLVHIIDSSGDYAFRDAHQKLSEARAAIGEAEIERLARIEALQQETLGVAQHLVALLDEWQTLDPGNPVAGEDHRIARDMAKRWTATAQPEAVGVVEPQILEAGQAELVPSGTEAQPEDLSQPDLLDVPGKEPPEQWKPLAFEPEMVYVPPGEFLMGSSDDDRLARSDEKPQHLVHLDAFWIGRYPVTNAQYRQFVEQTGHRPPSHWLKGMFTKLTRFPEEKSNHPVVNVSWGDAKAYCDWLAHETGRPYRLPTEAEWVKAARGPDVRTYPWGEERPSHELCNSLGFEGTTSPVGNYSPAGDSPYGCADLVGNVNEWCADWYDSGYYAGSPRRNPRGPGLGTRRVLHGGSWYWQERSLRSAYRRNHPSQHSSSSIGFRVAV